MTNGSKVLIHLSVFIVSQRLTLVSNAKRKISKSNKEACLTFLRLAAKLSEIITKFQGCSLKIQPRSSFDLNGLKNSTAKHFENT